VLRLKAVIFCSTVSPFSAGLTNDPKRQGRYEFKYKADGNNDQYQGKTDKIKTEFFFKRTG
jgi:hypothetical protein